MPSANIFLLWGARTGLRFDVIMLNFKGLFELNGKWLCGSVHAIERMRAEIR